MNTQFTTLGHTVRTFQGFDTFPAPASITRVVLESEELTSMCPITGQPDWYTITIDYIPDQVCLESKSLKLYLQKFRNDGIFGETLAATIADDLYTTLEPTHVTVRLVQKPRGGITITSIAERKKA